jgi:hypothetical protein
MPEKIDSFGMIFFIQKAHVITNLFIPDCSLEAALPAVVPVAFHPAAAHGACHPGHLPAVAAYHLAALRPVAGPGASCPVLPAAARDAFCPVCPQKVVAPVAYYPSRFRVALPAAAPGAPSCAIHA